MPSPKRMPNGKSRLRKKILGSKKKSVARKTKRSKYRGPPSPKRQKSVNRSPKRLGHGVSTKWVKDTFIVEIKRHDGSIIKFIPPFALMTGISQKTGKPTKRRLGMSDLNSLTKEQRAILGRY